MICLPCQSDITPSGDVVCEVQASPTLALACKMCAHIINPQTLKNVPTLLEVSQVMLLHTSLLQGRPCRVQSPESRLGVGWEDVWWAHLCRLAGRRTREECSHTLVQGVGSECAACRLDI